MKLSSIAALAAAPLCAGAAFTFPEQQLIEGLYTEQERQELNAIIEASLVPEAYHQNPYWLGAFFDHPIDRVDRIPDHISKVPPFEPIVRAIFSPPPAPPSKTIYQLLSECKYTTILTKIINEDNELVKLLNDTDATYTFFAPTDNAFRRILCHHHHHHDGECPHKPPSKEFIRSVVKYHLLHGEYSSKELFHSHTVPTLLRSDALAGLPQRVAVRACWHSLTVNFYSRIMASNIKASNGLIHALSAPLLPPPSHETLLSLVPTQFSTLTLALLKTNLSSTLAHTNLHGLTLLAPTNTAFSKLGYRLNAFLFSPHGLPYLRALLEYHIVPNRTLYSDTLYTEDGQIEQFGQGFTHLELPTLLTCCKGNGSEHENENENETGAGSETETGRKVNNNAETANTDTIANSKTATATVSIDIFRFGPYTSLKLNGHNNVRFADGLARDGNLHVLDRILIPLRRGREHPRDESDGHGDGEEYGCGNGDWAPQWKGEDEITVEELKERLAGWGDLEVNGEDDGEMGYWGEMGIENEKDMEGGGEHGLEL